MKRVVIGSTRRSAGKTSLILGLTQSLGGSCGYIKPFGDRLIYRKKRLWDHDAAVLAQILKLEHNPEDITIGFEHPKLTFMYDHESTVAKLEQMAETVGAQRDWLLVEGGHDLGYGASVFLDPIAVVRALRGRLVIVAGGDPEDVVDDTVFLKKYVQLDGVDFAGVVVNKIKEPDDFDASYRRRIEEFGVPILGVIPYVPELSFRSLQNILDTLFAKIIAGEAGMHRVVQHIMVGATAVAEAISRELARRQGALVITSGDRADVIVAALQANAAGIVLTNNMLPPATLVAQANERGTPMLLVAHDTFQAAKLVDDMEPLATADDVDRRERLGRLVREHVDLSALA